jgi:hypothetical protein
LKLETSKEEALVVEWETLWVKALGEAWVVEWEPSLVWTLAKALVLQWVTWLEVIMGEV